MTAEERIAALEQRLLRVEDELAIGRLMASYGPLVDAGDGVFENDAAARGDADALRRYQEDLRVGFAALGVFHRRDAGEKAGGVGHRQDQVDVLARRT